MRILLARPRPSPDTIGLQHVMIVEPLELEVLGGLARARGHECRIADFILERKSLERVLGEFKPDLLAVTGYITNVPEMIDCCRRAKALLPAVRTVAGGVHCEVCPEDLDDPAVDFRVVRNAVLAFPALVDALAGTGSQRGNRPIEVPGVLLRGQAMSESSLPPLDYSFPRPDRSLTAAYRKRYFYIFHDKVALMKTAFGCPYTCEFCFCRRITRGAYAERPLEDVIAELASIPEREIYIVDDDFLVSRARVRAFLDALDSAGIHKRYLIYGRADFIASNPDLIREFKSRGLRTVIVGLESFFDHELARYSKGTSASVNEKALGILKENSVDCFATVIAAPDWGTEEFKACADRLIALGVNYVNLQPYTPLPGARESSGGASADEAKLLVSRSDYHKWDLAHLTMKPEKLSPAEYYRQMVALYRRVLFKPAYLKDYLFKYKPRMWLKMLAGSLRVSLQYAQKIREAKGA
jgi:radical SAM superfamily enzyme YgiQ (UPF0313 family)